MKRTLLVPLIAIAVLIIGTLAVVWFWSGSNKKLDTTPKEATWDILQPIGLNYSFKIPKTWTPPAGQDEQSFVFTTGQTQEDIIKPGILTVEVLGSYTKPANVLTPEYVKTALVNQSSTVTDLGLGEGGLRVYRFDHVKGGADKGVLFAVEIDATTLSVWLVENGFGTEQVQAVVKTLTPRSPIEQ